MSYSRLILACMGLNLFACSMMPAFELPEWPVPNTWYPGTWFPGTKSSGSSSQASSSPKLEVAEMPWRSFILDARLRSVVALALANNRSLRKTIASIAQARALYGAQGAVLWPSVTGNLNISRSRALSSGTGTSDSTLLSSSDSAKLGLSAYEIDLFGRIRSLTEAALETYLASEQASLSTRISLIAETSSAWLTYAADQSRLAISLNTLDAAKQTLEITRKRLTFGVATRLDVRAAETIFQQARSDVASTTTQIAQDRNALELLVGTPVDAALLPSALNTTDNWMADVSPGLSSKILLHRPDVLQAEHQLASANANIGAARAAFFPAITLTAAGGIASKGLGTLLSGGGVSVWSIAPALSVPIFDGGANRANLAYAKAQRQFYVSNYELTVQTAFSEVSDALARRATIGEQLSAQTDLVAAASDSYFLADKRYHAGVDSFLNALILHRTLYAAQLALVTTQLATTNNQLTLYKVLGGGVREE